MTHISRTPSLRHDAAAGMLAAVEVLVPVMQGRAADLDARQAFPAEDMRDLAEAGLLQAPVPDWAGGLGAGTQPGGADLVRRLLTLCGRGNASVGRLFEAHVNALRLVARYGTPDQVRGAAGDAAAGHLFGLWVTDRPGDPLRLDGGTLRGSKGPCSGAGHCTRALVTAETGQGTRMALITLSGREPVHMMRGLHGMRAAANGTVTLDGIVAEALIGEEGDYLREPDFSCGAWRASAVAAGVLDALAETARDSLRHRGHAGAPMQQARFAEVLIAQETARLWVERAAARAEAEGHAPDQVAYVNLARIAVESCCLDALRHVQRSLGLAAFAAPHPAERLARDLTTYLRQPAPDEVLTEAAAFYLGVARC